MPGKYFEEFTLGEVFHHQPGRTVTEMDNVLFTCLTMNPQPLHLDEEFAKTTEFGKRLVNSILTLGIMVGLSVGETTLGTTVANLVARFNRHGLAALSIASGRGRKPTYDAKARAQIVATAQTVPDRKKDGTATWSLSTLQKRLRKEGLEWIGTNTIKRVLEDAGSSYQKTRTWCPTGTALRVRKSGVVTVTDPETEQKRA